MKLIAIDLDGTLLNTEAKISYESKEYLKKLKELGYLIVIATGRTLKSAILATDGAFFAHYVVSNSGGAIYDLDNRKLLKKDTISKETAKSILDFYNEDIAYFEFNDLLYHNKYGDIDEESLSFKKIYDINEYFKNCNDIFHMCISFKDDKNASVINSQILDRFKGLNSFTVRCRYGDKLYIEMLKAGVSKYTAVSYLANVLNIANENIIAIGDSENDLEMIKNSGVGVAVGNAVDIVKGNATYITKTNNEDGVIEFLKQYL